MSDKFDFDDFKNIDALGCDGDTVSDIDLETILRDYGEKKEDENIENPQYVQDDKKQPQSIDNVEIVKPQGISITGAFEAIHSEKYAA